VHRKQDQLIFYVLAYGISSEEKRVPESVTRVVENAGALFYALVGVFGVLLGAQFLSNGAAGFPLGTPGRLFSGGTIFILTSAIGLKVASTMITLFTHLSEEEEG